MMEDSLPTSQLNIIDDHISAFLLFIILFANLTPGDLFYYFRNSRDSWKGNNLIQNGKLKENRSAEELYRWFLTVLRPVERAVK